MRAKLLYIFLSSKIKTRLDLTLAIQLQHACTYLDWHRELTTASCRHPSITYRATATTSNRLSRRSESASRVGT